MSLLNPSSWLVKRSLTLSACSVLYVEPENSLKTFIVTRKPKSFHWKQSLTSFPSLVWTRHYTNTVVSNILTDRPTYQIWNYQKKVILQFFSVIKESNKHRNLKKKIVDVVDFTFNFFFVLHLLKNVKSSRYFTLGRSHYFWLQDRCDLHSVILSPPSPFTKRQQLAVRTVNKNTSHFSSSKCTLLKFQFLIVEHLLC